MERPWWQTAVFYQIYPRSFADGNGDGIGDLAGMLSRLDMLQELGIDVIWLSPHFPSPQVDWGYDISDYRGVAEEYGSLDQFRQLLDAVHQRGMHLILDLVLNHTSDQHPWFAESRSSGDNPKRDWYIWRKGKDGRPPNNWYSTFGGPAWEYDPTSGEWYYHFFFKEQPDLNWRNPEVKQAMFEVVRFWLEMGVDGFRLDAVGSIYEDPALPDNPPEMSLTDLYRLERLAKEDEEHDQVIRRRRAIFAHQHTLPEVHDLMKELRQVVDEYADKVLVGETEEITFYGSGADELDLVFNFALMRTGRITPSLVRNNQRQRLAALPPGAWPCNTLGNHDSPRMFSQFGQEGDAHARTRLNLTMLLTLKGTPFLYNGEEIGMEDLFIPELADLRDPLAHLAYYNERQILHATHQEALLHANRRGRDRCRSPLQWTAGPHGGFCPPQAVPWLPVHENHASGVNVAEQRADPGSLWHFYRQMLALRKRNPALREGEFSLLDEAPFECLAYLREVSGQVCLVALNYGDAALELRLPGGSCAWQTLYSSTGTGLELPGGSSVQLAPFHIWIAERKNRS